METTGKNLIGISGRAGSGKDLVGKIIQYLTNPFDRDMKTQFNLADNYTAGSKWEVKKFADKLKDIVCLLLGCTREQLEDREFKEKELGEEWWSYKFSNDPHLTPIMIPYLEAKYPNDEKDNKYLVKPTVRQILQQVGTEAMRNQIHHNIWVNSLFADYQKIALNWDSDGNTTVSAFPNWIITDMRFPNELKAVKDRGGITIRVNRPHGYTNPHTGEYKEVPISYHESETALDNAVFDWKLLNDGSIHDLILKVKAILMHEQNI